MQQTSIEWLENLYNTKGKLTPVDFYQAKKMNEEEIKNAYNAAYWGDVLKFETSEVYFNKTFKQ